MGTFTFGTLNILMLLLGIFTDSLNVIYKAHVEQISINSIKFNAKILCFLTVIKNHFLSGGLLLSYLKVHFRACNVVAKLLTNLHNFN